MTYMCTWRSHICVHVDDIYVYMEMVHVHIQYVSMFMCPYVSPAAKP